MKLENAVLKKSQCTINGWPKESEKKLKKIKMQMRAKNVNRASSRSKYKLAN